ncbi:phosphoheptose isomerase, partial [Klebsiella pneumoniae]
MLDRIKACFTESIQTQIAAAEALPDAIPRAAMTTVQSLIKGNKITCCGTGTSAPNAQHFDAGMINRFDTEHRGLPSMSHHTRHAVFTAITSDRFIAQCYGRMVTCIAL